MIPDDRSMLHVVLSLQSLVTQLLTTIDGHGVLHQHFELLLLLRCDCRSRFSCLSTFTGKQCLFHCSLASLSLLRLRFSLSLPCKSSSPILPMRTVYVVWRPLIVIHVCVCVHSLLGIIQKS